MNPESFKIYKTTDEYKALDGREKKRLRDKFRYMEKREEKLKYQKEYDKTHVKKYNEEQKQLRAEKTKSKKRLKLRHRMKKQLLENPNHVLGKRMFHVVITGDIDLNLFGKINSEDLEYLKSFVLPEIPEPERREEMKKYYQEHRDKKIEQAKFYRDKKKEDEDINSINRLFRLNDPNAPISYLEIQMKPLCYLDRFCEREISKYKTFHLLSGDEKFAFLEKCKKEDDNYLEEVKALSLQEKKQFLKSKNIEYK